MDSRSHVEFAKRLLNPKFAGAAAASLYPQIDRQPATLHRNFAHHISKVEMLTKTGLAMVHGEEKAKDESNYVLKRFHEERGRIRAYFGDGELTASGSEEFFDSAKMAFVSHLYLDTFNQPVQAFTPQKSNCSGQFELWDRIGDFRYRLYVDGVVEALRVDWLKSNIWKDQFQANEMMHAMVMRLADLAGLDRSSKPVARAISDLKLHEGHANSRAVSWCQEMEHELCGLHLRYLG